jgi:hypothetical protein
MVRLENNEFVTVSERERKKDDYLVFDVILGGYCVGINE